MKLHADIAFLAFALVIAGTPTVLTSQAQKPLVMGHATELVDRALSPSTTTKLTVTSPSFKNGDEIPNENTQYGGNIFPGLSWTPGPAGTRSYTVVVQGQNPSRADAATSIHLTLFNVPATTTTLEKAMVTPPAGSTYGPNVHGMSEPYVGPHAHSASKNGYHYQVLALDTVLQLKPGVEFDALVEAMKGHVLASGELLGTAALDPNAAPPASGVPNPQ